MKLRLLALFLASERRLRHEEYSPALNLSHVPGRIFQQIPKQTLSWQT